MTERYQFRGSLEFDAANVDQVIPLLEQLGEEIGEVPVDPGYPGEWSPGVPGETDASVYQLSLVEGTEVGAGDGTGPIDHLLSSLGDLARRGAVFETLFADDEVGAFVVGPSQQAKVDAVNEHYEDKRRAALRDIGVEPESAQRPGESTPDDGPTTGPGAA